MLFRSPRRLARGGAAFTRSQRGLLPASPLLPPSRLSSAVLQARVSLSRRSRARPLRWVRTSAVHRKAGTKLNGARILRGDRPRGCDAIAVIALSLDEGPLNDTKRGRDSLCRPRLQLSSTPRRRPSSRAFLLRPPPPHTTSEPAAPALFAKAMESQGEALTPLFFLRSERVFVWMTTPRVTPTGGGGVRRGMGDRKSVV